MWIYRQVKSTVQNLLFQVVLDHPFEQIQETVQSQEPFSNKMVEKDS